MKFYKTVIERLERKVDNLTMENAVLNKEMADLKSSMQFHSDTIEEKLLEVETKVSQVYVVNDENVKTLIDHHKNLHVKVRGLQDKRRRNNIQFDWLSQAQGEDWHGREAKLKKVIKENIRSENVEIKRAHRIGEKKEMTLHRKEQLKLFELQRQRESTARVKVLQTLGGKVIYE